MKESDGLPSGSKEYNVKIVAPVMCSEAVLPYKGKGVLRADEAGIKFTAKKKFGAARASMLEIKWDKIRELTNELQGKRRFRANFGGGGDGKDIVLTVRVLDSDTTFLQSALSALPNCVYEMRCPACGGPVCDGTCTECAMRPSSV